MSRIATPVRALAVAALLPLAAGTGTGPAVAQQRPAKEQLASPFPAELLKRHMEFPGCTDPADEIMPRGEELGFRGRLDDSTEIVGIVCDGGSTYNWPYAIYIVRDGLYADAERKYFADYALETGWYGSSVLYNANYDAKAGLLRGFSMASGLADCGSQTALQWNGNELAMVEFRFKADCDGKPDVPFPLIYSRQIGRE